MEHELMYSLKRHVGDNVTKLNDVIWAYVGVSLKGNEKPFATVEPVETENTNLSKERTYYEEIYHFQIGLFTDTHSDLLRIGDDMKRALRQPEMDLYDTSSNTPEKVGVFYADLQGVTPILPSNDEDESRRHMTYYDVEVVVSVNINKE